MMVEKWLRNLNNRELKSLYVMITNEHVREKLPYQSFKWTINHCFELSNVGTEIQSEQATNAQLDCIARYRQSGICVKCHDSISEIADVVKMKSGEDVHLIDHVFLSIHEYSGLCIDCIGEYLLDFVSKHYSDS